jgi:membrane fusion protein (multidrug efflux system)
VVAGLGWGAYEWLVASHYEETDNAYVQGNVIQITPQIGGTVLAITPTTPTS